MSTPKQALADLQKNKAWPIYYLYGEEPYKVQEFVQKLQETLFQGKAPGDFNMDRLDGTVVKSADVLEAIQSLGLFGGGLFGGGAAASRIVLVRAAHQMKDTELLLTTLQKSPKGQSPWEGSLLIFVAESLDGRKKFHQWLKKQGYALEFKAARDAELLQWVDYLTKKKGLKAESSAAELLAVVCDGSLDRLSQEIEKAWLYAGAPAEGTLTREQVAAVAGQTNSHEMIELVQAVLEKKKIRALFLTEKLIRAQEDALGFVGFLTWMVKNPARAGLNGLSVPRGRKLVERLVELDQRLKTSGSEPQALVEEFVIAGS